MSLSKSDFQARRKLQLKITRLKIEKKQAEPDSLREREIEQDLMHYRQRLANVEGGYGDTAAITGTLSK